jgi:non-specific serine/threonine protein kinase
LTAVPFPTRIRLLIQIARAVAAAHDPGVLHKDLKPSNILIAASEDQDWQIHVADFGSGALLGPARLEELGITNLGFSFAEDPEASSLAGTVMYVAPEVLRGQSPNASIDVYALGVLLYQFTAGDFCKPLSAGWEAEIDDPLIREDIADAACGDPTRRLPTIAALVERLSTLDQRRVANIEFQAAQQRVRTAEQRLARSRARLPWVFAAALPCWLA